MRGGGHDVLDTERHIVFDVYMLLMRHKTIPFQAHLPDEKSATICRGTWP